MSYRRAFVMISLECLLATSMLLFFGTASAVQSPSPETAEALGSTSAVTTTVATPMAKATVSATLSVTDTALAAEIDALMTKLARDPVDFGGSVLVARNGQPIFNKSYGMANYELDVPNTPQGKYRIAGLTKEFVAMAVLQLQQKGLLNVDDSICKYLGKCPEAWQPITIHDLMSHQSGIPDYWNYVDGNATLVPTTSEELIDLMRDKPLGFAPEKQFEYSDTNYIILGNIVASVAKVPFNRYLRDNILNPIEMSQTGMDTNSSFLKNRVSGYNTATSPAEYLDMSIMSTQGGMYSTVEDLLRWDQALYGDKLLGKSLRDQMFAPQSPPVSGMESTNGHYGYGWFIDDAHGGRRRIGDAGDMIGFRSAIDRFPSDKITVIILTNRKDVDPFWTVERIEDIIFPRK